MNPRPPTPLPEPDPSGAGGIMLWLTIIMVYVMLAPGIAALLINAYEVGVHGNPFSGSAIVAFYMFGWIFPLVAGVLHGLTRHWQRVWSFLAAVLGPSLLTLVLDEKMGLFAFASLTLCFAVAQRLGSRLAAPLPRSGE